VFCSSFVCVGGFEGGLGRGGATAVLLGDFKAFRVWICLDLDRKNMFEFFYWCYVLRKSESRLLYLVSGCFVPTSVGFFFPWFVSLVFAFTSVCFWMKLGLSDS
jgi:hypothetical protein